MEEKIEEIKSKLDIVDFISQYVQVKKSGRNFKALCPFHNEKSPSFVISPDRQIWHCFGTCGEGGDVIKFLMKWDNLTFTEALRELAQRTGVQLDSVTQNDNESNRRDIVYAMNNWAARYYAYLLTQSPVGKKALEYLKNRGINDKIIHTFELGYAPESWDSLLNYLKNKKKYSEEQILMAGLVVSSSRGHMYDRFRNRLIFPIKDAKGAVVGFSGRLLDANEKSAKYINSPETPVYHKRTSLFGIQLAKEAIRREDKVYLVEGEFDMIVPFQHGISNIVAIKGSALTKDQLQILKRYTNKIVLALDTDEAGLEAMKRGINEAEEFDFDIRVAQFSKGKDPDEAARADFITFKKELEDAVPLYDFLFAKAQHKYPENSPYAKKKLGDELVPYVKNIKNLIIQSHYIKRLAEMLEMKEEQVERLIRYARRNNQFRSRLVKKTKSQMNREEMMQKYLLSYIFQHDAPKKITAQVFSILDIEDLSIPSYQKIVSLYREFLDKSGSNDSYAVFSETLPNELRAVADEIYLYASGDHEFAKEQIWNVVYDVKTASCKRHISELSKIDDDESDQKSLYYNKILRELDVKELENLFKSV